LSELNMKYDLIYTSNVLEHIEDERNALLELSNSLAKGGILAIYVPAHSFLYTEMDNSIGHFRRYSKADLKQKTSNLGLELVYLSYSDSLGYLATLLVKFIGYKSTANLGAARSLSMYDKYLYPISKTLDALGARYIVGKNIIMILKKI